MKIELTLPNTKTVLMAGFCAVLNGLVVGLKENSPIYDQNTFSLLNNISIYWGNHHIDSDHGQLAQTPFRLYNTLASTISSLESFLIYFVPKTVKGPRFCKKISPGQSMIFLPEELKVEPFQVPEFNFHFSDFQAEEFELEANANYIEKNQIEEENEAFYITSQDRVTPGLVNLDGIVEEVVEKNEEIQIEYCESPEVQRLNRNGRWFRKSSHQFKFNPNIPNIPNIGPLPPIKSVKSLKYLKKSNSSQEIRLKQLLEIEDYKKIGLADVYKGMEKYIVECSGQSEDNWMD